jgi:hypothetical protein
MSPFIRKGSATISLREGVSLLRSVENIQRTYRMHGEGIRRHIESIQKVYGRYVKGVENV